MLKLLTNHSRLVLDMQIILPPLELQVYVAKDNGILRDGYTFTRFLFTATPRHKRLARKKKFQGLDNGLDLHFL